MSSSLRFARSFRIELLLGAALLVRCVPSYDLRRDPVGGGGEGGERASLAGEAGQSDGGEQAGGASASGAGGKAGRSAGGRGGEAGTRSGGAGTRGGEAGRAAGGGEAGTPGGEAGVAGAPGSGIGGSAGAGGSAGDGVRPCGAGGAPYAWANWCLPNHAGEGPYPQSYDAPSAGIVRDRVTGLIWEHPASGTFAQAEFAAAALHCDGLAATSYGGYADWRVPTLIELASLVDYGVFEPAIDQVAFPGTPSGGFWTSTPGLSAQAWEVDFLYGVVTTVDVTTSMSVRCVR